MNNEELFNELQKIESILGRGLDESCGACGLTREDGVKVTELRDSAVYALAVLKICKNKLVKKEEESHEKVQTKTK